MSQQKNYYEILQVNSDATSSELKSAYRKLARVYHPDIAGESGVEKFKEITEAYETLSDETKRKRYDILCRIFNYNKSTADRTTKKEAQKAERDYLQEIDTSNVNEEMTFKELCDKHFEYQKDKVKKKS